MSPLTVHKDEQYQSSTKVKLLQTNNHLEIGRSVPELSKLYVKVTALWLKFGYVLVKITV